ncbi:hypothetical protein [Leptothoe kymatousa]|uniref:Uncharacterized protein n=1 Tax=Leptothoe kymatousa TAU-MAC 1615 TaxID=2364775 RepID=A0ABS5Y2Q7_9CYAN|nr:hypothetical protein [Leptothoe kymatousa]MBT9312086.1 hypothetical protein [Leptothoe kymatousa TAU-MAC 1615]
MKVKSRQRHVGLYWLLGILTCGVVIAGKLFLVWGFDTYLYSLPIVGGVLASLEIVELASPILLAVLGLSLGALTYYLAPKSSTILRFLLLTMALPLILLVGHPVRHNLWVKQVSNQENLSPTQARQVTDKFLQQKTSKAGNLGFYWYTAQQPKPPIRLSNVQPLEGGNPLQAQLTELGKRQTGLMRLAFGIYTWLFNHAGWGLRMIYALLSGFIGLIYFYRGQHWANHKRRG